MADEIRTYSVSSETLQGCQVRRIDSPVQTSCAERNNSSQGKVCEGVEEDSSAAIHSMGSLQEEIARSLTLIKDFDQKIYEDHLYLKACIIARVESAHKNNDLREDEKVSLNASEE